MALFDYFIHVWVKETGKFPGKGLVALPLSVSVHLGRVRMKGKSPMPKSGHRRLSHNARGFIKEWAPGKLTSYDNDFTSVV